MLKLPLVASAPWGTGYLDAVADIRMPITVEDTTNLLNDTLANSGYVPAQVGLSCLQASSLSFMTGGTLFTQAMIHRMAIKASPV